MSERPTVEEMVTWFRSHYKDPADGVPHNSAEGGYQYIHGGPYDAADVIAERFPNADQKDQEAAVAKIEKDGLTEWVKSDDY